MARLPYLSQDDLPPEYRDLLARNINLYRALVHNPAAARSWNTVGRYLRFSSKLEPRLRELAILQIGYLARAPYEYSHHLKIGREFGVTDEAIDAMVAETEGRPSGLDPLVRAVLAAARDLTGDLAISDETFAVLEKGLGRDEIVDLVMTIAFYNGVVRILSALRIDVEPEYLPYLERHPLPQA